MSDHKRNARLAVFFATAISWLIYIIMSTYETSRRAASLLRDILFTKDETTGHRKYLNPMLLSSILVIPVLINLIATLISKIPAAYEFYMGKNAIPGINTARPSEQTPVIESTPIIGLPGRIVYKSLTMAGAVRGVTGTMSTIRLSESELIPIFFAILSDNSEEDPDSAYIVGLLSALLASLPFSLIPAFGYASMFRAYDFKVIQDNARSIATSIDNHHYIPEIPAFLLMMLTSSVNLATLPMLAFINFSSIYPAIKGVLGGLLYAASGVVGFATLLNVISMMTSVYQAFAKAPESKTIYTGGAYSLGAANSAITGLTIGMAMYRVLEKMSDSRLIIPLAIIAGTQASTLNMAFSFIPGERVLEDSLMARHADIQATIQNDEERARLVSSAPNTGARAPRYGSIFDTTAKNASAAAADLNPDSNDPLLSSSSDNRNFPL